MGSLRSRGATSDRHGGILFSPELWSEEHDDDAITTGEIAGSYMSTNNIIHEMEEEEDEGPLSIWKLTQVCCYGGTQGLPANNLRNDYSSAGQQRVSDEEMIVFLTDGTEIEMVHSLSMTNTFDQDTDNTRLRSSGEDNGNATTPMQPHDQETENVESTTRNVKILEECTSSDQQELEQQEMAASYLLPTLQVQEEKTFPHKPSASDPHEDLTDMDKVAHGKGIEEVSNTAPVESEAEHTQKQSEPVLPEPQGSSLEETSVLLKSCGEGHINDSPDRSLGSRPRSPWFCANDMVDVFHVVAGQSGDTAQLLKHERTIRPQGSPGHRKTRSASSISSRRTVRIYRQVDRKSALALRKVLSDPLPRCCGNEDLEEAPRFTLPRPSISVDLEENCQTIGTSLPRSLERPMDADRSSSFGKDAKEKQQDRSSMRDDDAKPVYLVPFVVQMVDSSSVSDDSDGPKENEQEQKSIGTDTSHVQSTPAMETVDSLSVSIDDDCHNEETKPPMQSDGGVDEICPVIQAVDSLSVSRDDDDDDDRINKNGIQSGASDPVFNEVGDDEGLELFWEASLPSRGIEGAQSVPIVRPDSHSREGQEKTDETFGGARSVSVSHSAVLPVPQDILEKSPGSKAKNSVVSEHSMRSEGSEDGNDRQCSTDGSVPNRIQLHESQARKDGSANKNLVSCGRRDKHYVSKPPSHTATDALVGLDIDDSSTSSSLLIAEGHASWLWNGDFTELCRPMTTGDKMPSSPRNYKVEFRSTSKEGRHFDKENTVNQRSPTPIPQVDYSLSEFDPIPPPIILNELGQQCTEYPKKSKKKRPPLVLREKGSLMDDKVNDDHQESTQINFAMSEISQTIPLVRSGKSIGDMEGTPGASNEIGDHDDLSGDSSPRAPKTSDKKSNTLTERMPDESSAAAYSADLVGVETCNKTQNDKGTLLPHHSETPIERNVFLSIPFEANGEGESTQFEMESTFTPQYKLKNRATIKKVFKGRKPRHMYFSRTIQMHSKVTSVRLLSSKGKFLWPVESRRGNNSRVVKKQSTQTETICTHEATGVSCYDPSPTCSSDTQQNEYLCFPIWEDPTPLIEPATDTIEEPFRHKYVLNSIAEEEDADLLSLPTLSTFSHDVSEKTS